MYKQKIEPEKLKQEFISLMQSTNRPGIGKMLDYLENKTDFYTAPASSKFHNNVEGGLLDHSLNVYHNFKGLLQLKDIPMEEDSIIICSLLHDLCKCNYYTKELRNKKVDNKWVQYEMWANVKQVKLPFPHSYRSIKLIKPNIQLKLLEELCIFYHMGPYGGEDYEYRNMLKQANEQYPQTLLFYIADLMSSYLDEDIDMQ